MTTFTRTWNAAYEAIPANGDDALEGAERIRNLKLDLRERLVVDHSYAGDGNDGYHKKVTLLTGSAPALLVDAGILYAKDVAGKAELHYRDEDNNEIQLTRAGKVNDFASGTKMLFQQTAAPTGWTKDTTHNDKALRIVSGAVSSGGATAFTTVFGSGKSTGSYTLTATDIPAHTHTGPAHTHDVGHTHNAGSLEVTTDSDNSGTDSATAASTGTYPVTGATAGANTIDNTTQTGSAGTGNTGSTGGGGGHSHTVSLDLQYVDVIIATKD